MNELLQAGSVTNEVGMERLKLLADYTTFHIGVYITLCSTLLGILGYSTVTQGALLRFRGWLIVTLILFCMAGACGGLIGSSIPYHSDIYSLLRADVGPYDCKLLNAETCIHLEHTFFWLGIAVAVHGVLKLSFKPK